MNRKETVIPMMIDCKTHQDDIIGTIQVSIINKRLLYLREFCEGLKLFNVYELIKENAALCKDVFVQNTSGPVDSDYVFLVLSWCYSAEGTSRRNLEEEVMDNFLATVEDIRTSQATQKPWHGRRIRTLQMQVMTMKL